MWFDPDRDYEILTDIWDMRDKTMYSMSEKETEMVFMLRRYREGQYTYGEFLRWIVTAIEQPNTAGHATENAIVIINSGVYLLVELEQLVAEMRTGNDEK